MSPRFEPDFTTVEVTTPVYPKGTYQLTIDGVSGQAWDKTDDKTNEVYQVRRVRLQPKLVGVYNSKGKLVTEADGKELKDKPARSIDLYIHSEGAMRMAKQTMMAVFGYNPRDKNDESAFNEWIRDNEIDFNFSAEPTEDGEGYAVTIGEGWEMLDGRSLDYLMDVEMYKASDEAEPVEQQRYVQPFPAGEGAG